MSIVKQALDSFAAATPTEFSHDRSQTVGASEVGQCARKVWYSKNEIDPQQTIVRDDEYSDGWGARVRGTVFENQFWVPAMRARYGDKLLYAGDDQKTFISGFLSATPDGMLIDVDGAPSPCVMVECKTADPRTNLVEAKDVNVFQTHVQMGLMRELSSYRPTHAIISYTDASFWSDVKEFVVEFNLDIYNAAKARALNIMTADRADQLKPEGWIAGGNECRYCPFTRACGIERRNLPHTDNAVDPQFAAEIRDLALDVRHYETERDAADAYVREAQENIKNRLREKGIKKIPGVVSWTPVKGRQSYDTKALVEACEAAGIDTSKFVTEGTAGDRLTIMVAKSGSGATNTGASSSPA